MTTQTYLVVENNVVTNSVVWDGDINTWTPPADATMLIQELTEAIIWLPIIVDHQVVDWQLVETLGAGSLGFTWDGSVLTTNEPKPAV